MTFEYIDVICQRKVVVYEGLERKIQLRGRATEYTGRIRLLSEGDMEKIIDLEVKTNIPEIRASEEKIRKRFKNQNQMLGFETDDGLIASVGWRFAYFSPDESEDLPSNFEEYSTPNFFPPANFNSIFHYGINVDPKMRIEGIGKEVCKCIFDAMVDQGRVSGCEYFVSDPRLHTYNGSRNYPEIERFPKDLKMREAIEKAMSGDRDFTLNDALRDPAFNVYYHLGGGDINLIKLMPDSWFPPDTPSGGYGIYVYKRILEE